MMNNYGNICCNIFLTEYIYFEQIIRKCFDIALFYKL